jgi:hypothetical protein
LLIFFTNQTKFMNYGPGFLKDFPPLYGVKKEDYSVDKTLTEGAPNFTPAAESHGLWPWMNAPTFGRDVAPLGRQSGATRFARGAPQITFLAKEKINLKSVV